MALTLSSHLLLFLWFSGVNHFVNPSSEAGSGMDPDYQQQDMLPMEDRYYQMSPQQYRMGAPPFHTDPIDEPIRRRYRLEDFLWTGSGDGPHPSEQDGGLAWEDNGGGDTLQPRTFIKVTKTMTLYRTVLTTIYPVEMTPTVISGLPPPISPTPHLTSIPEITSSEIGDGRDDQMWLPTPTFTPTQKMPEATASIESTTSVQPTATPPDDFSAESTDLRYWIQTSIKANNTAFRDNPRDFQSAMQKSLARVYASAFKRHLLSTLGVLSKTTRRRRYTEENGMDNTEPETDHLPDQIHRWLYVAQSSMSPSQLKQLATTAMNVTVTILNVGVEKEAKMRKVDLQYVVLAEGTPVPASSAVKELDLVTKHEMEQEIGYEIINKKAEALVAGPPEQMTRNDKAAATSPWLIVAVTTICLLVILLALIAFMVWKWKHNRLGDSNSRRVPPAPRPQSGITEIEEGVINPAFHGTPSRTGRRGGSPDSSLKSSPALSLLSARARSASKKLSEVLTRQSSRLRGDEEEGKRRGKKRKDGIENSPTSSEELRLHKKSASGQQSTMTSSEGSAEWKELLREPKHKVGGRSRQKSPSRPKGTVPTPSTSKGEKKSEKDLLRRRRRKTHISKIEEATLRTDDEDESEELSQSSGVKEGVESKGQSSQPLWSKGSTDAISLGNLDICQDTIAQTPSEYAKKLVPWKRPGSAVASGSKSHYHVQTGDASGPSQGRRPGSRMALPETIEEIPSYDLTEEDEAKDLDRDLSEKSFEMGSATSRQKAGKSGSRSPLNATTPDTKDAQVQTPTRISKTASHKSRAAPKARKSWRGSPGHIPSESVISTESEEIVEVHHINSSMSDEQNPLGRMRKRFHQFLDDAFNVMGNKKDDESTSRNGRGETQSAKVSISHEVVEKETEWRPWTSHVVREESLQKLRRPKSAAVPIGPPKRAWTASSERKTSSAKSKASSEVKSTSRIPSQVDIADENEGGGGDTMSSEQSQSHSSMVLSPAFIFPQYPAYPEIRVVGGSSGGHETSTSSQSTSQPHPPQLPSNDPAVPVIQAIKSEMKKLEKDNPKS